MSECWYFLVNLKADEEPKLDIELCGRRLEMSLDKILGIMFSSFNAVHHTVRAPRHGCTS